MPYQSLHAGARGGVWDRRLPELPMKPAEAGEPDLEWIPQPPMTAAVLPPMMVVPDPGGPYRYPLLQFIFDWNRYPDRAGRIAEAPCYDGDDPVLLPAIAVVVHALAERDGVPVPEWVFDHRAPDVIVLFLRNPDSDYGLWLRRRSVPQSAYHRVHIHPQMLDKGTPDSWLPWV